MPQVVYHYSVIGNRDVYNGRNAPEFDPSSVTGTPIPNDSTPITITQAIARWTVRDDWSKNVLLRKGDPDGTILMSAWFGNGQGEMSKNAAYYRSFGHITMQGDGGTAGTLKSGTEITVTIDWQVAITQTTPPTSVTVTPTTAETTARLAWSGAQGGTANAITSYRIQRRDSQNGADWSAWTDEGTVTSTSKTVDAPQTRGHLRMFRVCAIGSAGEAYAGGWTESPALRKNQLPADPANVTASPALHESGAVTLSWNASADPDGNFERYELEKQENGGSWEALGSTGTASFSHTPTAPRGTLLRYRVRAVDALGAASAWTNSNDVRRNRLPSVPTNLALSPLLHQSGGVTLNWTAAQDADNNLQSYVLEQRTGADGQAWSGWSSVGSTAETTITIQPVLAAGTLLQIRIRAMDDLEAVSDWAYFPTVRQNTPPAAPSVHVPTDGADLNSMEVLCYAEAGADPDSHAQTLQVRADQGAWLTLASGKGRIHVPGGNHTLLFRAVDALGAVSDTVGRAVRVQPATWSRAIHPGTVISNSLISHRADIAEMLTAVNRIRDAYGLSAIQLPGTVGRWADWKAQMLAMQDGLTACAALAGEIISWAAVEAYPSAAVINGIREAVQTL
jgi:hypothetical protein